MIQKTSQTSSIPLFHITTPELLAIRLKLLADISGYWVVQRTGHSSAASFPTGPVMAEPFISPFGLTI